MKLIKLVAWVLMLAMALVCATPVAMAAPVPSQTTLATAVATDSAAIGAERDLIKARLTDFGLSDKAAADRVGLLTDEEVRAIAADLNSIQVAGITSTEKWDTVTVLLLLILVVLIVD